MNWPVVSLSRALEASEVFVDGDWVESKDQDPDGDVRLIQLADVGDGEYIDKSSRFLTSAKARDLKCTYLKQGDILVARMPDPLGRACIFPGDPKPSVTVVDVCIIRPNSSGPDARFLMRCLNSASCRRQIAGFTTGTTRSRISRSNLAKIRIPLPPLPEQRQIAEILDKADALRAKRRAALAQLHTLTQSIFLDMFGDPATNPKGWPKVELGGVVKVVGGYAFKSEDFAAVGNPVVRISNLTGDGIDFADIARIHKEKLGKGIGFKIQPGDILIAMSGATTGKLGIVPLKLSENLYQNQRVGNYRISDTTRIQPDYLLGFLRSTFYQRFLWQLAAGVAQPNVSGWQLESAVIPLPLIELQHEFARRVSAVDKLKAAHRTSVAELDTLFASLQHRAFRGEL